MELKRMKLADLRESPLNPRTSFTKEGLEALADSMELTPGAPGEPLVPIIAVADGNVARVIDGARRLRAMKRRGKVSECWVMLCEGYGEADQAVAMLAADEREALTEANRGAHYQKMLMLGVPEDVLDKAARKPVAKALRRHLERTGGKVDTVPIGQLLAAEEFADDDEDYRRVMEAESCTWENVARSVRRAREAAAREAALEEALARWEAQGLAVAGSKPKGSLVERSIWRLDAGELDRSAPDWIAGGMVLVRPRGRYDNWEVCTPAAEPSEAEAAMAASKNARRRTEQAARRRRIAWIWERICQGGVASLPNTWRGVEAQVRKGYMFAGEAAAFCKAADIDDANIAVEPSTWMLCAAWPSMDHLTNMQLDALGDAGESACLSPEGWAAAIAGVEALILDGYKPGEDEAAIIELARAKAKGGE